MSCVRLSDVTSTDTAGSSQTTQTASSPPVARMREAAALVLARRVAASGAARSITSAISVLRAPAQQPELDRGEQHDHQEQHPGHRRGRAEAEEVLEAGLVQVLDDRARHVAGAAAG